MQETAVNNKIDAEKIIIRDVFSSFWFLIPEYQRSYVWDTDNVNELIDDLWFACDNKFESEYFLGSLVLRDLNNTKFREFEVLDGQQRLTTLFMLLAVIRDLSQNGDLINTYHELIIQQKNDFKGTPERRRIVYNIRDSVEDFIGKFLIEKKGTCQNDKLIEQMIVSNVSIYNMSNAILTMTKFFLSKGTY